LKLYLGLHLFFTSSVTMKRIPFGGLKLFQWGATGGATSSRGDNEDNPLRGIEAPLPVRRGSIFAKLLQGVTMKRIPFGGLKPLSWGANGPPLGEGVTMKRIPFGGLKDCVGRGEVF